MSYFLIIEALCVAFSLVYWYQMDIARLLYEKYGVVFDIKDLQKKFNPKSHLKNKQIVLTIDDVPNDPESFSRILNALDKTDSKATFFVISSYVTHDMYDLLIRAVKSGHHLANHGQTDKLHALMTKDELNIEISHCQKIIDDIYQHANMDSPNIFYYRPGCGHVSDTIYEYCKEYGYIIVLGSNYCSDPQITSATVNKLYVLSHLKDDDIIILHDRDHTSKMLEDLLFSIKSKGYNITSLDDIFEYNYYD